MAADDGDPKKSMFSSISRRFQTVPCARTAFLYGILGGFGTGLASFLLTSRVKRSADIGIATFAVATLFTFGYCRYTRANLLMVQKRYEDLRGLEPVEVAYRDPGDSK